MGVLPICQLRLTVQEPKSSAYPKELKTLGNHLRARRLDLGLFQRDVAAKLGADEASVWNWEKDRVRPEPKWWPTILAFLGYDPRPEPQTLGERLAEVLKVDPTTLSRWELGKKAP